MEIVPAGVASCLYTGISERIKFVILCMDMHERNASPTTPELLKRDIKNIEEAMDFYAKHCVLSFAYLEEKFEPVKERYNGFMRENFPEWIEENGTKA
ncbi:hypothetical protein EDM57_04945 [Brevibacillus gelatini]|uniref:Uncharacterized protein n=1 Tax=Brevibacillus gelatini TaxID=1655277 RepID=A0A3M8B7R2_9BACL|nr:hypothetical protein [Brevibacillus gelatini]RNB59491.1 hypothetical protein EDM57_04945 [Brevibacillus gelatini]